MEGKVLAQLGAVAFVAVAMTVAVLELSRGEDPSEAIARPKVFAPADPLATELSRCQLLGEQGLRDAACLSAWAENRRRFLNSKSLRPPSAAQTQLQTIPQNTTIIFKNSNEPVLDPTTPATTPNQVGNQ